MSNNNRTTRSSRYKNRKSNNTQQKKKKRQKRGAGTWIKRGLLVAVFVLLLVVISGAGLFTYYASQAPELTDDDLYGTYASELVDRNGEVFFTLSSDSREFASASEYPDVLEEAVLAIEDQRFYDHAGFDPIGIARAGIGYLTEGEIVGGGSTITQQLIKLSLFSTLKEDQTLERKSQEVWLAIQLERRLSKEQILTLYLNRVHMAGNVYGMGTAAQEYYGKHVSELELHEAALLAGLPQAPNRYNPYKNPEAAKNRRDTVLYAMVDAGYITKDQHDQAVTIPVTEGLVDRPENVNEDELYLDGYITAVLDEVYEKTDYNPYTAGLEIHTNIDVDIQKMMYDLAHDENYIAADDELQTAITLMDPNNGELLGIVGGRNLDGHLSLNRATENTRNVASTIKPLTVYGPAIEFNQRSTYEQVIDEEYTVPGTDWTPRNWDGQFLGQMSTRDALVNSRNIPAAKIFNEELDHNQVNEFLERLGIDPAALTGADGVVPSSAIDGSMTPLQLAGAFAAFASGGTYTEPYTVKEIVTQAGETINTTPESTKAMEDYTAYMVTDMLKGVIDLHGSELAIPGYNHAGKTGTSNYSEEQHEQYNIPHNQGLVPDSWFVGYSPEYTMSVWVGYDKHLEEGNQLSNANGKRQLPRHFYQEIMTRLAENSDAPDWEMPDSVSEVAVVNGSNPAQLATPGSPGSITELFVKGHEPSASYTPQVEEEPEDEEPEEVEEEPEDEDVTEEETEETPTEDEPVEEEPTTPRPPQNDNDNEGEEESGGETGGTTRPPREETDTPPEENEEATPPEDNDDETNPDEGDPTDGE